MDRLTYHRVTHPQSPAPEPGAERTTIPSLLDGIASAGDWRQRRRPQLVDAWRQILGKLEPGPEDLRWFADPRDARVHNRETLAACTRVTLDLPLERDFRQPALLLLPHSAPPWPAVIAWTSTTPDWRQPEEWWGAWLAARGYAVLCSWAHIRHYRGGANFRTRAHEQVYERFGRWLGLSRMVWDVRQQARYLASVEGVDAARTGFIGFSLSAKTAIYVAAFAPEIAATVAIDPHIAINGGTNYFDPWYMDWTRPFDDIRTPKRTVLTLLKGSRTEPGFEHDHHELLALAAPRPFLLIGGSQEEEGPIHSDDLGSWGYVNRAREVYRLLGVEDRLAYVPTADGHRANGPRITPAWQEFFARRLGV